jgi:hypothetical protein
VLSFSMIKLLIIILHSPRTDRLTDSALSDSLCRKYAAPPVLPSALLPATAASK